MCSKLPNDFDERAKDLEGFLKIIDSLNSINSIGGKSLQHPLSQIMSAKNQPVIKDVKEALRQAELAQMRLDVHVASIGSLIFWMNSLKSIRGPMTRVTLLDGPLNYGAG